MSKILNTIDAKAAKTGDKGRMGAVTRRGFVVGAAMAGTSLLVGCSMADVLGLGADTPVGAFGPFIRLDPDGTVTVVSKHLEMGQGNHAGLAAIVAEEMDADWETVKVVQAPANAKLYANTLMGVQGTGGSTAIANSWTQLRKAGAAARAMFVEAAAAKFGAPASSLTVKNGVVSDSKGQTATFADLLSAAAKVKPPADPALKKPEAFTLIGTERVRRKDSLAKATGGARFTQDVHKPDMLVAVVAHPPLFGATVKSFDASETLKVPGVVSVIPVSTGVAVLAPTTYAAKLGRDALKVVWDETKAEKRSTDELLALYKAIATGANTSVAAQPFDVHGPVAGAFTGDLVEFTYDFPYLAHATMEPMNCVAEVDGRKCRITTGSQVPSLDQLNAAKIVYTLPGAVEIETLFAGGSFGRRANPPSDYVAECVEIAKAVGKGRPVKLVWTREDDMRAGRYRPLTHHRVSVKLDADGYPAAWRQRVVTQSIQKDIPGAPKFDNTTVEGALGSPYLAAIPVVDAQVHMPDIGVPVLWWRSVGATHTAFAMEHTIDQLARRAGKDPAAYRRALYLKAGPVAKRHLAVLDLVLAKSGWDTQPAPGTARGLAVHESFGTVVAQVAEVSLVDGAPRVGRVVTAVDCGVAVAPDQIAAQVEGATCYGLSAALYGKVTLDKGRVVEGNFDTHRVLRFDEAPRVETHILPSGDPPSGVGEPGTPLIAPAVANALLALGSAPTTALPFLKA